MRRLKCNPESFKTNVYTLARAIASILRALLLAKSEFPHPECINTCKFRVSSSGIIRFSDKSKAVSKVGFHTLWASLERIF